MQDLLVERLLAALPRRRQTVVKRQMPKALVGLSKTCVTCGTVFPPKWHMSTIDWAQASTCSAKCARRRARRELW